MAGGSRALNDHTAADDDDVLIIPQKQERCTTSTLASNTTRSAAVAAAGSTAGRLLCQFLNYSRIRTNFFVSHHTSQSTVIPGIPEGNLTFTSSWQLIIEAYHFIYLEILCSSCRLFHDVPVVVTGTVSAASCVAGCVSLGMVGYAEYRQVGHGHVLQKASVAILAQFTKYAINNCGRIFVSSW